MFASGRRMQQAVWIAGAAGLCAALAATLTLAAAPALAAAAAASVAFALGMAATAASLAAGRTEEPGVRGWAEPDERAEARLADLAPLLEALPDPALLVDGEGRVAGSNQAARNQLQFEASGLKLASILRNPELLDAAQAAALDGVSRTVEYQTASAVEEHFKAYVAPVAWGAQTAALIVFNDRTALVATERMRSDFLANASHELKTPVAALSLLIETLEGPARDDPEGRERFFGMMRLQIDRMRRLIEDLLSLSRIELNEHVPPRDRIDLLAVAAEAADACAAIARERGVRIDLRRAADVPQVTADRFQMTQVLQNLIDNAVKYTPSGGVVEIEVGFADGREAVVEAAGRRWPDSARIALLTAPLRAASAYVYARVADQGPGIARRHLPRLGERFFRVEREDAPARAGTGLGLAIVKHVVSRHRGGLLVESVPGQGSAFGVYFEAAPEASDVRQTTFASRN